VAAVRLKPVHGYLSILPSVIALTSEHKQR
jgi:hypothetical protein